MSSHRRVVLRCALGAAASVLALLVAAPALADSFVPGPGPAAPAPAPAPSASRPDAPESGVIADGVPSPDPLALSGERVGSSATEASRTATESTRASIVPLRAIVEHVASGEAGTAAMLLAAAAGLLAAAVVTLAAERLHDVLRDAIGSGDA